MSHDHSIEQLQEAWRASTGRHAGGGECPSDETLFNAVEGRVDAESLQRIVGHTARCGACAQSWRAAVEIQRARPDVAGLARQQSPPHRQPVNWALAAAAAVAATVGVVWMLPQFDPGAPPPGDGSVLRGDRQSDFRVEAADQIRLPDEALVLSWEAISDATTYRVRIADSNLHMIHAAHVDEPEFRLPADALTELDAGETLYWSVTAELQDGSQLHSETGSTLVERTGENE